jgi:cellulose synthase/poly-beta-1,6-N-acetylglucosamine synthase-like glycosyltransferase
LSAKEYEVILVDDGSTDDTGKIAEGYSIRVLIQQNRGPAAARNNGAKQAKGDILVFTDSDCELDFHFLEKIIAPIEQNLEVVGTYGSYRTKQEEFVARFAQVEMETRYRKIMASKYIDFIGTYAAAYRKDIFNKCGGFDTAFPSASGEDTEFSYKLYQYGYKMVFEQGAFVYHQHPSRLSVYMRVKFYRGYWRVRLYKKHPAKTINDSYTPQLLKLQILSVPFLICFAVLSLFDAVWLLGLFFIFLLFLLFSTPFYRLFQKHRYSKGVLTPFMLFLRALSIFLGVVFGILNELRSR